MAFLRRGNVKVPHKHDASIVLHRVDGTPVRFPLRDINCWEEHEFPKSLTKVVMVYHFVSSCAVRETFDEIDTAINGKAVTNVK